MFGGSTDPPTGSSEMQSKLAGTTLLQFCKYTNRSYTCICVILLLSGNFMVLYIIIIELVFCCPNKNQVVFLLFCHSV